MIEVDALFGFVEEIQVPRLTTALDEVSYSVRQQRVQGFRGLFHKTKKGTAFIANESPLHDSFGNKRNTDEYYIQVKSSLSEKFIPLLRNDYFRCTRIDLKLDVVFEDIERYSIRAMANEATSLKCKQTLISSEKSTSASDTLYLKDRRSDCFVRIYEKSKEAHLDQSDVIRIEIQCNVGIAQNVYASVLLGEVSDVFVQLWRETTENRLYFDWFARGTPVDLKAIERTTNYKSEEDYVNHQIVSRLRKYYDNQELFDALILHVIREQHKDRRSMFVCQHFFDNAI